MGLVRLADAEVRRILEGPAKRRLRFLDPARPQFAPSLLEIGPDVNASDNLTTLPGLEAMARQQGEGLVVTALLNVEKRFQGATIAAEVLYSGRDPFTQKLFVDKGESAGVQPGQAVIDEVGVVGQVTRVFPYMAEVTLLTDKDHAVPVKVERSGVRSVMYGAGSGRLPELRFLSPNVEIQAGDKLLTSGIDGTYPSGLAVAQVVSVERETGQIFARVTCKPLAGVEKSPHLLILGRAAAPPQRPEEPAESDTPRKGRGRHRG